MPSHPAHRSPGAPAARAGFSLIELLLSLALGALLLTAATSSAQVFSRQVKEVRDEVDNSLEAALVEITDRVRFAWVAESPSEGELLVHDALGRSTRYALEQDALVVTRPSGAKGVLLEGVDDVDFSVDTVRRLRDDTPLTSDGPWFSVDGSGATDTLMLMGGEQLGIGFTVPVDAPDELDSLDDVEEEYLQVGLNTMTLPISLLDMGAMEFCHLHAVQPHNPSHFLKGGRPVATVEIFEARFPGDGRPIGAAVVSDSIVAKALPQAAHRWIDTLTGDEVIPPEVLDPPDGVAWGWWDDHPHVVLDISPPTTKFSVGLRLDTPLQPGSAYTMVITVIEPLASILLPRVEGSSVHSRVALRTAGGTFEPQPITVPLTLTGPRTYTQTTEAFPVGRVTVELDMVDGRELAASAGVAAQLAIPDPWLGSVAGEVPTLQLAGY